MPSIRELQAFFADVDRRQRPDARSRNRVISKYVSVQDTVGLSSDTLITTVVTPPFLWSTAPGSTANELAWSMGEWS